LSVSAEWCPSRPWSRSLTSISFIKQQNNYHVLHWLVQMMIQEIQWVSFNSFWCSSRSAIDRSDVFEMGNTIDRSYRWGDVWCFCQWLQITIDRSDVPVEALKNPIKFSISQAIRNYRGSLTPLNAVSIQPIPKLEELDVYWVIFSSWQKDQMHVIASRHPSS
jgi:hypothetical protein